jgi:hypothetical protein
MKLLVGVRYVLSSMVILQVQYGSGVKSISVLVFWFSIAVSLQDFFMSCHIYPLQNHTCTATFVSAANLGKLTMFLVTDFL